MHAMEQLGVPGEKLQLVLNRSNAFTGISLKAAEGALGRRIDHQIVNDYRAAIAALNTGSPFLNGKGDSLIGRSVLEFVRALEGRQPERPRPLRLAPAFG
jgi:Flp pilus assembly CpaE family ATPase